MGFRERMRKMARQKEWYRGSITLSVSLHGDGRRIFHTMQEG